MVQVRKDDDHPVIPRCVPDIGQELETVVAPTNFGPGYIDKSGLKIILEIPTRFNNSNNFLVYPYRIEPFPNTNATFNTSSLNTLNIPSRCDGSRQQVTPWPPTLTQTLIGSDPDPITNRVFKCGEDNLICQNITVTLESLPKGGTTGFRLISRLWEGAFSTPMTGDLGVRSWVEVMEGADVTLDSKTGPEVAPVRIIGVEKISRPVSFWIIVGSISGGLCVLSLIIIVLYKVGFFNRNRPPAEFYRDRSKTIEVVDDSKHVYDNDAWFSGEIEEEENDYVEGDFVFRNPMCDVDLD